MEKVRITAFGEQDYSGRKKEAVFVQYSDEGNLFRPVGRITLVNKLIPTVYTVGTDMQGLYFEIHELKTDDLLKFNDKRQKLVLSEIDKFWGQKEKFTSMGLVHKRGLLLYGAPGTGKSCILKLVMGEVVKEGDIVLIIKTPRHLTSAIRSIRQVEPDRKVLAILEDVDDMVSYDSHELLGLFDGDSQQDGMLILGTTNYLDRLPPRMVRVGRFDRVIEIGNPGKDGRRVYFETKLGDNVPLVSKLVKATKGFTFAQMRETLISHLAMGYSLEDTISRIKNGFESLNPDTTKALEAKLEAKIKELPIIS